MIIVQNISQSGEDNRILPAVYQSCMTMIEVLKQIPLDIFIYKEGKSSSIGAHFRHCLDRMTCLIEGIKVGLVDYDKRRRDQAIENDPAIAIISYQDTANYFQQVAPHHINKKIQLKETVSTEEGSVFCVNTSVSRELLDILNHNTHHLASIRTMLLKHGIIIDEETVKTASTITYERNQERRQPS